MNADEFQTYVNDHPAIHAALLDASASPPRRDYGAVAEAATLVLLFPLVRFVLMEIGLPWLTALKRYSEVQRQRVERWIDHHAEEHGLDPDQVEEAAKKLLDTLERDHDIGAKQQWERLMALLKNGEQP